MNRSEKTTTSNGTHSLTSTSPHYQYFIGTTDHMVVLPDVSNLPLGQQYKIHNKSTGIITLKDFDLNNVGVIREQSTTTVSSYLDGWSYNISTDSTDSYFSTYSPDQINITNSWTDITWRQSEISDMNFSHTDGSPEITINRKGQYIVQSDISTHVTSGNSRSQVEIRILKNGVLLPGSKGLIYNRTNGFGGSVVVKIAKTFDANDIIKVQCIRQNGNSQIETYPDGSRFSIQRINR